MEIQDLNAIANDIAVARLELSALEEKREKFLAAIPAIANMEAEIEAKKAEKEVLNEKLLAAMRENFLKSWKTDQAVYSRATRRSALLDPVVKKQIEDRLKNGESIEHWTLSEKEYISIRLTK